MRYRYVGLVLIAGAALLQGCERAKTKLDREVDRLCAIDGGVRVYETVELSKENFGPNGEVFPQYRGLPLSGGRLGPDYYVRFEEQLLIEGDPSLRKSVAAIIRKADSKVLGTSTNFSRRGGDIPGPWHGSAKTCLHITSGSLTLESSVFVQQETSK